MAKKEFDLEALGLTFGPGKSELQRHIAETMILALGRALHELLNEGDEVERGFVMLVFKANSPSGSHVLTNIEDPEKVVRILRAAAATLPR